MCCPCYFTCHSAVGQHSKTTSLSLRAGCGVQVQTLYSCVHMWRRGHVVAMRRNTTVLPRLDQPLLGCSSANRASVRLTMGLKRVLQRQGNLTCIFRPFFAHIGMNNQLLVDFNAFSGAAG